MVMFQLAYPPRQPGIHFAVVYFQFSKIGVSTPNGYHSDKSWHSRFCN